MERISIEIICVVLAVIVFAIFITIAIFHGAKADEQEREKNLKEYGVSVAGEESDCLKFCGHTNYFYRHGTGFKQAVCQCGDKE